MGILTEEEKKYINKTKGTHSSRGISDTLVAVEKLFGKEKRKEVEEAMKEEGYDIPEMEKAITIPVNYFIALLILEQKILHLDEEGMRKVAKESAKLSFLLKFASRFLVSLETIVKNANTAWRKYYNCGELKVVEFEKEQKKIVAEVRDFWGHPTHCRHLEGYFEKILFFVLGKKAKCREVECPFEDGGDVHRFLITWE